MDDSVKFSSGSFISTKYSFAEFSAIEPGYVAVLIMESKIMAEGREDSIEGTSSRFDCFAGKDIGVYDWEMVLLLKKVGYGGLASRNTSCQADYQHQDNDGSTQELSHPTLSHSQVQNLNFHGS